MSETIKKSLGEGHGKGEIYAALAHDNSDRYGGLEIKSFCLNWATYHEDTGDGRACFANRDMYIAPYEVDQLDIVAPEALWLFANDIFLVGDVHYFSEVHETTTTEFDVLLTDPGPAGVNAIHALIDAGVLWTSGNMVAMRGNVDISGDNSIVSATGVWAGIDITGNFTRNGLVCGLNVEVQSNKAASPNALVYIQSLPKAGADFSAVPYIAFTELEGGQGSNVLFSLGHAPAGSGRNVTAGTSGDLLYNDTIRIIANGTAKYIPLSTAEGSFTTEYPIVSNCTTTAITLAGTVTADQIAITGAWGAGITFSAISIGDYSTALALPETSNATVAHWVGMTIHLSADIGQDFNVIPLHAKFTTTGDCASGTVAQAVYGRVDVSYNLTDAYGLRGHIGISGSPEVNQMYSIFGTMDTTACNVATTGVIALFGGTITGSADITRAGSTAVMCGMYLNWNVTTVSMTIPVYGIMVNIREAAYVDYGIAVHGGYCNEAAFLSEGTSHPVAFEIKLAHDFAFKFPTEGTNPCAAYTTHEAPTGRIKCKVGGSTRYLYYWD